jgi:Skp family chaperone for outer membrane proteins
MITTKKLLLAAALAVPGVVAGAGVANAQSASVAFADPQAAVGNTKAWATARTQIETTYKTQLDQAEARRTAIQKELQPLYTAFETARNAPNANQASLQAQAKTIQDREAAAQRELGTLTAPAQRAQAYAIEQISAKLGDAATAATTAKKITLLLKPDSVLTAQPVADLTPDITAQLDRLVPSVSITPPAGWQPGQQGQQGAGAAPAAAAPAAAPAGRPAGKAPQGR